MKALETRQTIVAAADKLIYERGFEFTSFADIAQVVGISRGNFYYHFKTKDEILDAVIERRILDRAKMLDDWVEAGQSPKHCIANFIRILLMNNQKIRAYGCPIGTLFSELAKLNHPAVSGARDLYDLFRIWLVRRFAEMGRSEDADALAMHILARSQGAASLANAYPQEPFLEQEVKQMLAWLDAVADGATIET
ncbi:TetR family transcriptional regulator [Brevirhabdus pacifica]|uniref:TetR family transcriptional regulator n=1 Tax=Brevirhabdus pacifica TaxID=1267768 RepID=A0A1U7DEH5_9RHOB|nr:TetR/AcrR family transcriptional regulator [Brevirhabdus pacifica]APX88356.1 TetR family transcriptional regulator [Brevirhabdus pacifica]OWU79677.1 transcriptional regulator [Loktanella sp. 22II-4b]PJJ87191.1 TetR family transcriptional regulator [Brevirhabdus pacifica]